MEQEPSTEAQVDLATEAHTAADYMSEGGVALRQAADMAAEGSVKGLLITLANEADSMGQDLSERCSQAETQAEMWDATDTLVQAVIDFGGPLADELLDLLPEADLTCRGLIAYAYTFYRGALAAAEKYQIGRGVADLSPAEMGVLAWLDENTEWVTA